MYPPDLKYDLEHIIAHAQQDWYFIPLSDGNFFILHSIKLPVISLLPDTSSLYSFITNPSSFVRISKIEIESAYVKRDSAS